MRETLDVVTKLEGEGDIHVGNEHGRVAKAVETFVVDERAGGVLDAITKLSEFLGELRALELEVGVFEVLLEGTVVATAVASGIAA